MRANALKKTDTKKAIEREVKAAKVNAIRDDGTRAQVPSVHVRYHGRKVVRSVIVCPHCASEHDVKRVIPSGVAMMPCGSEVFVVADRIPSHVADRMMMPSADTRVAFVTKDSGQREDFVTGSRRDTRTGKGRFDLIPPLFKRRLAGLYERGAVKYGERNWEKGQPLMRYLDSAERHLADVQSGDTSEDHLAAIAWNVAAYMWTLEEIHAGRLPSTLDDRPAWMRAPIPSPGA